jgi:hypothetical protein
MIGCPRSLLIFSPRILAIESVDVPGGNPTCIDIGLSGKLACAKADCMPAIPSTPAKIIAEIDLLSFTI